MSTKARRGEARQWARELRAMKSEEGVGERACLLPSGRRAREAGGRGRQLNVRPACTRQQRHTKGALLKIDLHHLLLARSARALLERIATFAPLALNAGSAAGALIALSLRPAPSAQSADWTPIGRVAIIQAARRQLVVVVAGA